MKKQSLLIILLFCAQFPIVAQYLPYVYLLSIDPENNNEVCLYFKGSSGPGVYEYRIWGYQITSAQNPIPQYITIGNPIPHTTSGLYPPWRYEISDVSSHPIGLCVSAQATSASWRSFDETNLTHLLDSTMYLALPQYNRCNYALHLQWNDYNRWRDSIDYYRVTVKSGTNTWRSQPIAPVQKNMNFEYPDLPPNGTYRVYVTAFNHQNRFDSVNSNSMEITIQNDVPPSYIYAEYATINAGNQVEMAFRIAPTVLDQYVLSRSTSATGPFEVIDQFSASDERFFYTDSDIDPSARPYYYSLRVLNRCDSVAQTSINTASTLFLSVTLTGQTPTLSWTAYQNWPEDVSEYTIERSVNHATFENIGSTSATTFPDESIGELAGTRVNHSIQYRIRARRNVQSDFTDSQAESLSNTATITLPVHIRFFDAFIPGDSENNGFEPLFDFLPSYYDFKILNRNGSVVYQSREPENTRWDGRVGNGGYAPEGVYRYTLIFHDEFNHRQVLQGSLTVIRQD